MQVAFFSNFLNHHQLPFCLEMYRLTEGNFTFIATEPVPQERIDFGYKDMDHMYPFVLATYDSSENEQKAMKLALSADVIITGSAPEKYTVERIKHNKLTFRYLERPYKQGIPLSKIPRKAVSTFIHHGRYAFKPLYILCASAYTAYDFGRFGAYWNKTYKWGYFPEFKKENIDELFKRKNSNARPVILWAARLLPLKHPEMAVKLALKLKEEGYNFELHIIGSGEMEGQIKKLIEDNNLDACVTMLGSMSPEEVRNHMEQANIFLFTSDFNEGWGAVLNESMNSACAVVASHAIGSVGFLLDNGKNGLIFCNENQKDIDSKVMRLLDQPELREKLGRAAYKTIYETWCAEVAAKRFLMLCEYINEGNKGSPFNAGPCSAAIRMSNKKAAELLL